MVSDGISPVEIAKLKAEMRAFDALGPKTRDIISHAPEKLDASKLPAMTGLPLGSLATFDTGIAKTLQEMIKDEYGDHAVLERRRR